MGKTSYNTKLYNFIDKPSPPQGPLEATGMTETSCTIAWRPPADDGGTPLLDYTVQRKETSKRSWQSVGTVTETSLHMTDLVLNTPYNFRITARNKEGDSEPYVSEDPIIAGRKISKALYLLKQVVYVYNSCYSYFQNSLKQVSFKNFAYKPLYEEILLPVIYTFVL